MNDDFIEKTCYDLYIEIEKEEKKKEGQREKERDYIKLFCTLKNLKVALSIRDKRR